jgi:hypothetical protein
MRRLIWLMVWCGFAIGSSLLYTKHSQFNSLWESSLMQIGAIRILVILGGHLLNDSPAVRITLTVMVVWVLLGLVVRTVAPRK